MMAFDPGQAAILQLRLDIGQLLDDSAEISFLQSAHFRIELMVALDNYDKRTATGADTLTVLQDLRGRVSAAASPVT
jgi:hypothetical protein